MTMIRCAALPRLALAMPLLLLPAYARAADIQLTGTDQEVQALAQLLDMAVKQCGIQCAPAGLLWTQRINQAVTRAQQAEAAPPTPPAKPVVPDPPPEVK